MNGSLSDMDDIYLAFASSTEHLKYLRGDKSWPQFEHATGITSDALTAFAGFLVFLDFAAVAANHSLWYDEAKLIQLCELFRESFKSVALSDELFRRLLDVFSLEPARASEYALPTPFFRIGERYLRFHGFTRIMSPTMGLLTIVIRKHEMEWSRTLGSTLASAASVLAGNIPKFDRLHVASQRTIRGGGDIDLALYDEGDRSLLICEVKTVYDKHRTTRLLHRFEEAKVNIARAVKQLRHALRAASAGELNMKAIFGKDLHQPSYVAGGLLTWFDAIDLTIGGTNEDIMSVNFATFEYLVGRSKGDLREFERAVTELRNIWPVAALQPIDLGIPVPVELEVQGAEFDPASELAALNLSSVTMGELSNLGVVFDDQAHANSADLKAVSYISDTRRVLARPV